MGGANRSKKEQADLIGKLAFLWDILCEQGEAISVKRSLSQEIYLQ